MTRSQKGFWVLLGVVTAVVLAVLLLYVFSNAFQRSGPPVSNDTQYIQASFTCNDKKTIDAVFMNSTTSTTTGNFVQLTLSDGRQLALPEVVSADGGRYANADQTFVFWNVGNQATIWENGVTTFTNCITRNS